MTKRTPTRMTRPLGGVVPLMLLGACLFGAPPAARAQTAEEIIAANIAASGGEDAIAGIRNFTSRGRVTVESPFFGTLEGTLEVVRVPGRGYYEHAVVGPIQQDKGWDGARGWELGPNGLRTLEGVEFAALQGQSFVNTFVALRTLAPPGLHFERLDDAEVGGRAHHVIAVRTAGGPTITTHIDRDTLVLNRTSVMVPIPGLGEMLAVTDLGGYETVDGVMLPTRVTQVIEGVSTTTIMIDETVVNTAVDESIFAQPAGGDTPPPQTDASETEGLYAQRCAMCHDGGAPRAATRDALARLPADTIRLALTSGSMRALGADLTGAQIDALARLLGTRAPAAATRPAGNTCPADTAPFAVPFQGPHWNGWGTSPLQHRFQSAEMAGLAAEDVPRLRLKWAFGFPGANRAFAQPAVAGGRLFAGSATNTVYALDAETGCQHWAFQAEAPVRTAVSLGPAASGTGGWVAYFADRASTAYAVDAVTGTLVWKRRVGDHPAATITGAPTLFAGTLYVGTSSSEEAVGASGQYQCCTFRGSVSALDAATGEPRWRSHVIPEEPRPVRKNRLGVQLVGPSGAGIWSAPTVDAERRVVYVTTGDSYSDPAADTSDAFVAFDLDTGKMRWWRQTTAGDAFTVDCDLPEPLRTNCPEANGPDHDFGSSAMLVSLPGGRRALVAGQKSGMVHAVDPDRRGEILWQTPVGVGGRLGGVQWGTAFDGNRAYVAVSDVVPEAPGPGREGGQPTVFGVQMRLNAKAGGGLYALDPATGEVVWHTPHPGCADRPGCSPAQSAAVTAMPGVVFSGGLDGHLRAYAAADGEIVWDVDTTGPYDTVNGVPATGGSIDGPGPVVVDGMLFVNSGYTFIGGMPGLLAFSVDGR